MVSHPSSQLISRLSKVTDWLKRTGFCHQVCHLGNHDSLGRVQQCMPLDLDGIGSKEICFHESLQLFIVLYFYQQCSILSCNVFLILPPVLSSAFCMQNGFEFLVVCLVPFSLNVVKHGAGIFTLTIFFGCSLLLFLLWMSCARISHFEKAPLLNYWHQTATGGRKDT
jgi:hypothetical protein